MFTFNENFRRFRDDLIKIAEGDIGVRQGLILSIKQLDDTQENYTQLGKFIAFGEGMVVTLNIHKLDEIAKSEILRVLSICSIKKVNMFENIHKKSVDNL